MSESGPTLYKNSSGGSGGVTTVGTIDSQSKAANGLVIAATSIFAQTADATHVGLVSIGTQVFGGAKTLGAVASEVQTIGAASSTAKHQVNGGLQVTTRSTSSSFTVDTTTSDNVILIDASGAAKTVTLPAPTNGRVLTIKDAKNAAQTNNITIARNGSEKINNVAASLVITINGNWVTLASDGTDWFTIASGPIDSAWASYTPTFTGFGTASSVDFQWKRFGDSIVIMGKWTPGTTTATEARVSFPTGVTSASTTGGIRPYGYYFKNTQSTTHGGAVLIETSVAYMTFGDPGTISNSNVNAIAKVNGDTFGTVELTTNAFTFPVAGWGSY